MPNGHAALALVPDALSPVERSKDDPSTVNRAQVIDTSALIWRIGEAVAHAALAVCAGVEDWRDGGRLRETTRRQAGDTCVRMYELQEEAKMNGIDFDATARAAARQVLRARHGAALRSQLGLGEAALDAALDDLIRQPLDILAKVTAAERLLAH